MLWAEAKTALFAVERMIEEGLSCFVNEGDALNIVDNIVCWAFASQFYGMRWPSFLGFLCLFPLTFLLIIILMLLKKKKKEKEEEEERYNNIGNKLGLD